MAEELKQRPLFDIMNVHDENLFHVDQYISGTPGAGGVYQSRRITQSQMKDILGGGLELGVTPIIGSTSGRFLLGVDDKLEENAFVYWEDSLKVRNIFGNNILSMEDEFYGYYFGFLPTDVKPSHVLIHMNASEAYMRSTAPINIAPNSSSPMANFSTSGMSLNRDGANAESILDVRPMGTTAGHKAIGVRDSIDPLNWIFEVNGDGNMHSRGNANTIGSLGARNDLSFYGYDCWINAGNGDALNLMSGHRLDTWVYGTQTMSLSIDGMWIYGKNLVGNHIDGLAINSSKLGFFGVTPISQPVLNIGSSTDDIINMLQEIGLCQEL